MDRFKEEPFEYDFEAETSQEEQEWGGWLGDAISRWTGWTPSRPGQSQPTSNWPGQTQAAPNAGAATRSSALRANAVRIANQEWQRWNAPTKKFERDPQIRPVLQDYWQTGVGLQVNPNDLGSTTWQNQYPWSAAFISWVMRKAGAGKDFNYNASHSAYIKAAKDNKLANNSNPFKAYRVTEARPEAGDLVCKSRSGSGATYDNIQVGMSTHCDVVTEVQPGKLVTIGGNLSDSVSKTNVTTDSNGYINVPGYFAVIKHKPTTS